MQAKVQQERRWVREFQYRKLLKQGFIISLLFHIFIFQSFKRKDIIMKSFKINRMTHIEVMDIPATQYRLQKAVISRPIMPIPTEDDDVPEDETIEFTELTWDEWPLP